MIWVGLAAGIVLVVAFVGEILFARLEQRGRERDECTCTRHHLCPRCLRILREGRAA